VTRVERLAKRSGLAGLEPSPSPAARLGTATLFRTQCEKSRCGVSAQRLTKRPYR
jgi:hypothetical protein